MEDKKVIIVADLHLGTPNHEISLIREKKFIRFLTSEQPFIAELIILGDLFDFWFEYRTVVPKGYFRLLSCLAELQEQGIPISLFSGNHDLWLKDYFPKYLNIPVFHESQIREWFGKKFFLAHGDGKGPKDYGFKWMKKAFQNPFLQFCFRWLHPDIGVRIANYFSQKSRATNQISDEIYHGESEWLIQYFYRKYEQMPDIHYFVFGHRHLPMHSKKQSAQMFVLGDWINHFAYLEITANQVEMKFFENECQIKS